MLRFLNKMKKVGHKGFTLVELMIVVAIIGILAAIAIPQFAAYRTRAFNTAAQSDLRNVRTSLEAYFVDNQRYPAGLD
jgi:type IV pilus assembly protein PilA